MAVDTLGSSHRGSSVEGGDVARTDLAAAQKSVAHCEPKLGNFREKIIPILFSIFNFDKIFFTKDNVLNNIKCFIFTFKRK